MPNQNDSLEQLEQRKKNLQIMHGFFTSTNHPKIAEAKAQLDAVHKELSKEKIRRGQPIE